MDKWGDRAASCHNSSQAPGVRAAHFDTAARKHLIHQPQPAIQPACVRAGGRSKGEVQEEKEEEVVVEKSRAERENNRILYCHTSLTSAR